MFYRVLFFCIGAFACSWGIVFNMIYLTLFDLGYSLREYAQFIIVRYEIYLLPIGFIIMFLTVTWKKKDESSRRLSNR